MLARLCREFQPLDAELVRVLQKPPDCNGHHTCTYQPSSTANTFCQQQNKHSVDLSSADTQLQIYSSFFVNHIVRDKALNGPRQRCLEIPCRQPMPQVR
jgi:hypothetical protein